MPHPQLCHAMPSLFYDIIIRTPSYSMSLYVSCHILNSSMRCHHYLSLSLSLSWHHIHWLLFFIHKHLWHQWKLYTQQYPPLALMVTPKHSPPLTIMTKDNLLRQCCTYFDIGFPISLLFNNSSFHHISPLTELGYLTNVLSFMLTFHVLEWYLNL